MTAHAVPPCGTCADGRPSGRNLGRRELTPSEHPAHGESGIGRHRTADEPHPDRARRARGRRARRDRRCGAAADRGADARLGDRSGRLVPAGLPRRAHSRDGAALSPHRIHPGRRIAVRPGTRHRHRGDGQHAQRLDRTAAGKGLRLADRQTGEPPPSRFAGRPVIRTGLARGAIPAVDPRGALFGAELRRRCLGCACQAVPIGNSGRTPAGNLRGRHSR